MIALEAESGYRRRHDRRHGHGLASPSSWPAGPGKFDQGLGVSGVRSRLR